MNILILGSGGREHSLAWAVMQNPKCDKLIVAPGNAGIAQIAECADFDIEDGGEVVTFVAAKRGFGAPSAQAYIGQVALAGIGLPPGAVLQILQALGGGCCQGDTGGCACKGGGG